MPAVLIARGRRLLAWHDSKFPAGVQALLYALPITSYLNGQGRTHLYTLLNLTESSGRRPALGGSDLGHATATGKFMPKLMTIENPL